MVRPKFPTPAHAEADRLLGDLAAVSEEISLLLAEYKEAADAFYQTWAPLINSLKTSQGKLIGALEKLEKENQVEFFGELKSCRVDLPRGALLYELTRPVVRRKTVTPDHLEKLGYPEAVKIAKSTDWDLLETWPEARLIEVGTKRKEKEVFSYELKEVKDSGGAGRI